MKRKVHSVNIKPRKRPRAAAAGKTAYHHGNLREALVQAALQRLEGSEQAELSLRELARDAGVTANAAYRHFADKNGVLAAVAAAGFRQFTQGQRSAAASAADPRRALIAMGHAYIRFAREHPALFRLMFGRFDHSGQDQDLQESSQAAFAPLLDYVSRVLKVPAQDPRALAAAVRAWGLVHGLSNLLLDRRLEDFGMPVEAIVTDALQAFGI